MIGSTNSLVTKKGGLIIPEIYKSYSWQSMPQLPYYFHEGCAVVFDGEIHLLGSEESSYRTLHYKYNGTRWMIDTPIPFNFYGGCAVEYNGELHVMGSTYNTTSNKYHYKYNKYTKQWTSVSTLPIQCDGSCAVVYNGEIHLLGSVKATNYSSHYKWDGTSWTSVSTLPYYFISGNAVVYNNEIHILAGSDTTNHYKWDGTSWTSVSTLPSAARNGCAVVHNNEIHLIGGGTATSSYVMYHRFDGTNWVRDIDIPYNFVSGASVVYNNEIHIMGSSYNTSSEIIHYRLAVAKVYKATLPQNTEVYANDIFMKNAFIYTSIEGGFKTTQEYTDIYISVYKDSAITMVRDGSVLFMDSGNEDVIYPLPFEFENGAAVYYKDELHLFGGTNNKTAHYILNTSKKWSFRELPFEFENGEAIIYNDKVFVLMGTSYMVYDGSTWVTRSLPFEFINGCVVMYNNTIHLLCGIYHYAYDGSSWVSQSVIPYELLNGAATVSNNEIHIMGGTNAGNNHYVYNGTLWYESTELPFEFENGCACSLSEAIHIFGGINSANYHYKYNGTIWVKMSDIDEFYNGSTIITKDEIHLLGGNPNPLMYKKYIQNSVWVQNVTTMPYIFTGNGAVVHKGEIHLLGSISSSVPLQRLYYKWTGNEWIKMPNIDTDRIDFDGCSMVSYNDELHAFGPSHYKLNDNNRWVQVSTTPYIFRDGCALLYKGQIHIIGGGPSTTTRKYHYKWDGTTWISVSTLPFELENGEAIVFRDRLYIMGQYSPNTAWYVFNDETSTWSAMSPILPIGMPRPSKCVVYRDELHIFGSGYINHYKWNGIKWDPVGNAPALIGEVLEYNDEIHMFGSTGLADSSIPRHLKLTDRVWADNTEKLESYTFTKGMKLNGKVVEEISHHPVLDATFIQY